MKLLAALPLALALVAAPLARAEVKTDRAAGPSFTLIGEDGKAQTVDVLALHDLPLATATISHEGKTFGYKGYLLTDLLKRVDAPLGKDMRGPALSDVVIVTAKDGYVVTLALSDLEPSIRAGKVILADATAEGVPLGDKDGPLRLVIDGDLKPARSERNVASIEVRRLRTSH